MNLNPDEHLWSYINGLSRRIPLTVDESLTARVDRMISDLKTMPQIVKRFFGHPQVQYVKTALGW